MNTNRQFIKKVTQMKDSVESRNEYRTYLPSDKIVIMTKPELKHLYFSKLMGEGLRKNCTKVVTVASIFNELKSGEVTLFSNILEERVFNNPNFIKQCFNACDGNLYIYPYLTHKIKTNPSTFKYILKKDPKYLTDIIRHLSNIAKQLETNEKNLYLINNDNSVFQYNQNQIELLEWYRKVFLQPSLPIEYTKQENAEKLNDTSVMQFKDESEQTIYICFPQILIEIKQGYFAHLKSMITKYNLSESLAFAKQCIEQNVESYMYFSKKVQLNPSIVKYIRAMEKLSTTLLNYLNKHYSTKFNDLLLKNFTGHQQRRHNSPLSSYLTAEANKELQDYIAKSRLKPRPHFGDGEKVYYKDLIDQFMKEFEADKKKIGRPDLGIETIHCDMD